jgi:prefoldin subunit 5
MSDALIAEIHQLHEETERLRAEIAVLKSHNNQLQRRLREFDALTWGQHSNHDCDD